VATVRANGVDLCVSRFPSRANGDSPVVVVIHGLTVDHSGLNFTLGMPLSVSAHVVLYDLRGHGRSEVVPSGYRIADHVADLVALLDELDIAAPVHLVACSYGGVIALAAAIDHPERVASLTLVEALLPYEGWGRALAGGLEGVAEKLAHDYTAEEAMETLDLSSPRKAMGIAKRAERLILETTLRDDTAAEVAMDAEAYARLKCRVQAVYGDESHVYWLADVLRDALPAAELHTISGVGHLDAFLQTQMLKPLITDFVSVP
jgi:pimeloyl-ACP methyl ester carboxylesterase